MLSLMKQKSYEEYYILDFIEFCRSRHRLNITLTSRYEILILSSGYPSFNPEYFR